jgi:hypothetical protein
MDKSADSADKLRNSNSGWQQGRSNRLPPRYDSESLQRTAEMREMASIRTSLADMVFLDNSERLHLEPERVMSIHSLNPDRLTPVAEMKASLGRNRK